LMTLTPRQRVRSALAALAGNELPGLPRRAVSVDDAIDTIRAYVRHKEWTIHRLAKEARLPRSSLRFLHTPDWAPKSETLRILYSIVPPDFDPSSVPPAAIPPVRKEPEWPEVVPAKNPRPTAT
jgi:hypothetical protein